MSTNLSPEERGIKIKSHVRGSYKTKCPECQPPHNKRDNPLTITINDEGTVWFCHHCEWSGSYFKPGLTPFTIPKKKYKRPVEPKGEHTSQMVSYFHERGISEEVLKKFNIQDENGWYAFQYYNENREIENIKYRTKDKRFKQTKDAKQILYNYVEVHDKETVVFVEGEMDVLSCSVAGYPATSLPNGAPKEAKYKEGDARYKALENCELKAEKIILFTDSDEPGRALHKELLHRFGRDRCWFVATPEDCKDANEVLMKHGPERLKKVIDLAEPYPVEGLYTANDYYGRLHDLYEGNYVKPFQIGIEGLDEIYKLMTGTFHTVTGIPNHGKSLFLDQVLITMAENYDWRFAIFSPEHSTEFHIRRMAQMYKGKAFEDGFTNRMTKQELDQAIEFIHSHFYFIETRDHVPSIDLILSIAKSSIYKYGIKGLVIDPFNEVSAKREGNVREDEHIRDFISLCKRFCRLHDLITWVVAHPTKLQKGTDGNYAAPSAYDISGAAHWHNMADAVLTVHRDYDSSTTNVITRKIREQGLYGTIGQASFYYNFNEHRFVPNDKMAKKDWNDYDFDS